MRPHIDLTDTIVARATAAGQAGVAIVRLSGHDVWAIAERLFRPTARAPHSSVDESHGNAGGELRPWPWGRMRLGLFVDGAGGIIDRGLAVGFPAPRSYTGQDVVEFHVHGAPVVVEALVAACVSLGARPARPGEFTLRAHMHGKLGLGQAQAVEALIAAPSLKAARAAQAQLDGGWERAVDEIRRALVSALAWLDAGIDFADDEPGTMAASSGYESARAAADVIRAEAALGKLVAAMGRGRVLRDGLSVAIVGAPNVGKSSLLNRLLGEDRVLVSDVPGTTRDTVAESMLWNDLRLRFVDTAGLRADSDDPLEVAGMARSRRAMAAADVVLVVFDATRPPSTEEVALLGEAAVAGRRVVTVWNKIDAVGPQETAIEPAVPAANEEIRNPIPAGAVALSARTGQGIDALMAQIRTLALGEAADEDAVVVHERLAIPARAALAAVRRAATGLGVSLPATFPAAALPLPSTTPLGNRRFPEIVAAELREALRALGEISGESTPEDVLGMIFSTFCVGK